MIYEVSGISFKGYDTKIRVEAASAKVAKIIATKRLAKVTKCAEVA